MSNITKSGSLSSLPSLRDFFNISSFFDGNLRARLESGFPAVNISENEKEFSVDVAVPGFKKDDIKIKINDDILTITAENKIESEAENNKEYTRREYSYSAFTRSFYIPDNVNNEQIDAHFEDGILKIKLPKTNTQMKLSKEISIN